MMGSAQIGHGSRAQGRGRARCGLTPVGGCEPDRRARRAGEHHREQVLEVEEVHEVMNTIRSFTAEDATVIFGSVFDEAMGDDCA